MTLPPLPKALRSTGAPSAAVAARRVDEHALALDALVSALRSASIDAERRIVALEARPAGGGGGVTVHADLSGLGADDHTQYLLEDGSRALSGDLSAGSNKITDLAAPTNPNDAARLADVSGVSFGAHTDLTVGGAGADGVASTAARSDHVHGLPAFGTTAGTFCEGDDSRLIANSGTFDVWDVDAPPASPHADDDECDGSGIAGAWTVWDVGGYQTRTAVPTRGYYEITGTGNGSERFGGLYKAIPASEFCVTALVSTSAADSASGINGCYNGVFVGNLTTPSTGSFHIAAQRGVAARTFGPTTSTFSNYAGTPSQNFQVLNTSVPHYLRIRVNGTSVQTEWSANGLDWAVFQNAITTAFTPAHVGWACSISLNGASAAWRLHWIRFTSGTGTSAFNQPPPGRLIRRILP